MPGTLGGERCPMADPNVVTNEDKKGNSFIDLDGRGAVPSFEGKRVHESD